MPPSINLSLCLCTVFLTTARVAAFVSHPMTVSVRSTAPKPLHMMDNHAAAAAATHFNNFLVATIDSDIANVPENEFAPIFAGGILVMFGGVLSALIVGFILESSDGYANVIADSYAQGAEDEEFWKGLSDEEKKKTQDLLQRLRDSKEGKGSGSPAVSEPLASAQEAPTAETPVEAEATPTASGTKEKDPGMFSDY